MKALQEINELFNVFGRLDKKTMNRANVLKAYLFDVVKSTQLMRYNEINKDERIKLLLYETIGYLPLNYRLLSLEFVEFFYFNCDGRNYWNCFIDFDVFNFHVKRYPDTMSELDIFTNLDEKTKDKIFLKYILIGVDKELIKQININN